MGLPHYVGTVVSQGGRPTTALQKILVIGQKEAGGTAVAGDLIQDVTTFDDIDTLFGKQSLLNDALREMLILRRDIRSPENPQIDVISLDDDGGAVDAAGTLTFAGTATAIGSFTLIIGSQINHSFTVNVAVDDTGADIANNLEILINLDDRIPVIVTNDTLGALTFTSVNGGEIGNNILLKVDGTAANITDTLVGMTAGATNPSLIGVFDPVTNIRYQGVVAPSEYGRQYLEDFLEPRFNTNDFTLLDGMAFLTNTDTFANLLDLVDPALGLNNSRVLVTIGNRLKSEPKYAGGALRESNLNISAQFAFIRSLRLTNGAFIQAVIATALGTSLDSRGGPALASLPYFNTRGFKLPLIDLQDEWISSEQLQARERGLSLLGNNDSRSFIEAFEMVTSYKKDSQGFDDATFKFLNFVDTESTVREIFKNEYKAAYPQSRMMLGEGNVVVGRNVLTAQSVRTKTKEIFSKLVELALVDDSRNEEVDLYAVFAQSLTVTLNRAQRSVTVKMIIPIVSQAGTFDVTFEIDVTS